MPGFDLREAREALQLPSLRARERIDRPPRKDVKKDFQFKNRIDAKVVIEDWRRM